jgi:hypothetical protein
MTTDRFVRAIAGLGLVFWLGSGLWAFFAPKSFYDNLAEYPPYNEHLFHDLGAFSIGIGAFVVFALLRWTALQVALGGVAVASVFHAVAHIIDHGEGGKSSDAFNLSIFALLMVAAAAATHRSRTRESVAA